MTGVRGRWSLAAAAVCALVAVPSAVRAEADLEATLRRLRALELDLTRAAAPQSQVAGLDGARRLLARGQVRLALQDYDAAAALLGEVVEAPDLQGTPDGAEALYGFAEALYGRGSDAAAARVYDQILALPGAPHEREVLPRLVDLAFRAGDFGRSVAFAERARRILGGNVPAEVLYTAAKATWKCTDLPAPERRERALSAFGLVPPPYDLAAAYFQGVVHLEAGARGAASVRFESCTRRAAADAGQREIRDLCHLALARLAGSDGRGLDALAQYQSVSRDSPRFDEALHEIAWLHVRGTQYDLAARGAALLAGVAPESPLAPSAMLLQGRLELKLGRFREASDTYGAVVGGFAPVRAQLGALLAARGVPGRSFTELLGRVEPDFAADVGLPPRALRWMTGDERVREALVLADDMARERRALREAAGLVARLKRLLGGSPLDASPHAREGLVSVSAVANGTLAVRAGLSRAEQEALALGPDERAHLARMREARRALEERFAALPAGSDAAVQRARQAQERLDVLDTAAFQLGYVLTAQLAANAAAQAWLEGRPAETGGAAATGEELRQHRVLVDGYEEDLWRLRLDIVQAEDDVLLPSYVAGEESLREAYAARVAEEERFLAQMRAARPPVAALAAIDVVRTRVADLERGTAALRARLLESAGDRVAAGLMEIQQQAEALGRDEAELAEIAPAMRGTVDQVLALSAARVHGRFSALVAEADVGLMDATWARKRERVETIQHLSIQRQASLDTFDAATRGDAHQVRR